jgi:hypothetical protein
MNQHAHRFPDAPAAILQLPTDHRGFPVPWFVEWIDEKPDFRVIGYGKWGKAQRQRLCWVCGGKLGRMNAFVIGPMCAVNRISAEPPSHPVCADFAARCCPFLANPRMRRNEKGLDELGAQPVGGDMIARNPGVALVWWTLRYQVVDDGGGGRLIHVGHPERTSWYAQGREATRAEILASIESGLPLLRAPAEAQDREEPGSGAVAMLERMTAEAMQLVPA